MENLEALGLNRKRWQHVLNLLQDWCDQDKLPSVGLTVARSGKGTGVHLFGRQTLSPDSPPVRQDAIFLVASITKPVVATAVLLLVERGRLSLSDRVTEFIPEFGKNGKHGVTVRHLLTHTSGLPDMLPNNQELRAAHAPLSAFVEETCQVKLDFPPGRAVRYQSMGFAILGKIIQRITGKSCAEFLQDEIFLPLGMNDTALGADENWFQGTDPKADRIAEIRISPEQEETDWNWNSRYWRSLGAPWGGLLTTPADLSIFSQMMLNKGRYATFPLLGKATIQAATRNQLAPMPDIPEQNRRCYPWGLGWRLNWPNHSSNFGDLLGQNTYGHWGATGTVFWIDPDSEASAVILTTQPQEPHGYYLSRASNAIAAAIL